MLVTSPIPRQRWRLTLACGPDAPALQGRDQAKAWDDALDRSGLPVTRVGRGPARIVFAAPRGAGMAAEAEPADIVLTETWPIWRVREALADDLPQGWRLVDLEDVWLGEPVVAGEILVADYRVTVAGSGIEAGTIAAAARALLDADAIPRERAKGSGVVTYDLRPLLVDVGVADQGPPVVLRIQTRLHPSLGSGRPEEVVAALATGLDRTLNQLAVVRERVAIEGGA